MTATGRRAIVRRRFGARTKAAERDERLGGAAPAADADESADQIQERPGDDERDGQLLPHGQMPQPKNEPTWYTIRAAVYAMAPWYTNMKAGQRHDPDSRFTTASVLMH